MFMILIAIVLGVLLAALLFWYAGEAWGWSNTVAGLLGVIFSIALGFAIIAYVFCGWSWFAAEHEARIINREYHTNYTQAEVFWASNVIDTIRELDRKRIELNGDIMREQKDAE
jgi:lipopolysaccharide export LptBFGC system permease protein LptF